MPRKDESLIEKQRKQLADIKTNSEQNQEIKRTSTFFEGGMNMSSSKRLKTDFNAVPKEKIKKKQTSKRNLNDIEDYSLKNKFTELKDAEELDMERIDELEQELYGPKVKNFTEEKKELSVEEQEEAHVNELTKLAELNLQCDNFVHKRYRRLPGELYSPKKLYSYCRRWSSVIEIRKTIKKRIDDKISEMQAFAEKHGLDKDNIEEDVLKKSVNKSINDKKEERKEDKIPEIKEEDKKEENKNPELNENKKEENKQEQKDQNALEQEKLEQERIQKEIERQKEEEKAKKELENRRFQIIEEEQRKLREKEEKEKEKKEKEEKEKKEKEKRDKEEKEKEEKKNEEEKEKNGNEEKEDEKEKNENKEKEEEKNGEEKSKEKLAKDYGFEILDLSLDDNMQIIGRRLSANIERSYKKDKALIELLDEKEKKEKKNKEDKKEDKQENKEKKEEKKNDNKTGDNNKQDKNEEKDKPKSVAEELGFELIDEVKEKEKQQDNKQENKEKKEEYDTKWFNQLTYDEQIKFLAHRAGDKTGLDTRKEKDLIKAIKEEIKKEKKKNKEAEKKEKNQKNLKDKKQEPKKEDKKNPEVEKNKKDQKNNKKPEVEKNKKPEIQENNKNKEKNKQNQPNPNGEQNKEKNKNDQQNKENNDVEIEIKGLGKFVDVEEMLPPLVKASLKSQRALKKAVEDAKKAREEKQKKSKEDEKNRKEENKKKKKELRENRKKETEQKKKESEEKKKQEKERKDKEKAEKAKAQKKYYIPNTETRISNDIKDYTEEKKKQYVDQLAKKKIKMFANRDEAVNFRTANSHRVKGSKDGYAWNEDYDKDIAKAVDWIIEYFMVKDSSWSILQEEKKLEIPNYNYTIKEADYVRRNYEGQETNNCYCCAGTATYNLFIRNELANKREVNDQTLVGQLALRDYKPQFADKNIMKEHIAKTLGMDPGSKDVQEATDANYSFHQDEILKYAGRKQNGKRKTAVGSIYELADFFLAKQKDIAMHRMVLQVPSAQYKKRDGLMIKFTKAEQAVADLRYNNVKACFLNKVHEVLQTGNTVTILGKLYGKNTMHYLTIYGIEGNKLLYMDSLQHDKTNLKADVDEFFLKRDGLGQSMEINWFSKVGDVKQLTDKYKNLNYDKENGFSLKERNMDEINFVGHTLGVDASENVPGVTGVIESIYVPKKFGVPEAQNN